MATRTIALTVEERSLMLRLLDREWGEADQARMGTRPGSVQERAAEDYQILLSNIQAKLKGATDEL